ncbi:MAG: hypothetical protein R3E02_09710 [Blastomonas sp.]
MQDAYFYMTIAASTLVAVALVSTTALRGWREWLAFRRMEIDSMRSDQNQPSPTARIEIADLKERIRKLEAIAAGVEF